MTLRLTFAATGKKITLMDISNLNVIDSEEFTSYSDPDDSRVRYIYARFRDKKTNEIRYGVKISQHLNKKGGEMREGKWTEVSESDFWEAKNRKR